MALHGPIQITVSDGTSRTIGVWTAQALRAGPHEGDPDVIYKYHCIVYADGRWDFELEHRYSDGALVLAAKVLTKAAELREKEKEEAHG